MAFCSNDGAVLPLKMLMYFGRKLLTGPAIALHSEEKWRWRLVLCVCPYKLSPLDDTMTLATRSR